MAETIFSLTTRVRSSGKLSTFITDHQGRALSPQLYEEMARRFVKEFPMLSFRDALPEFTGRLKKSLRLVQVGPRVYLRYEWYGPFVAKIEEIYQRLALPLARRIAARVVQEAFR